MSIREKEKFDLYVLLLVNNDSNYIMKMIQKHFLKGKFLRRNQKFPVDWVLLIHKLQMYIAQVSFSEKSILLDENRLPNNGNDCCWRRKFRFQELSVSFFAPHSNYPNEIDFVFEDSPYNE